VEVQRKGFHSPRKANLRLSRSNDAWLTLMAYFETLTHFSLCLGMFFKYCELHWRYSDITLCYEQKLYINNSLTIRKQVLILKKIVIDFKTLTFTV
jgi:hypothetical protein